MFSLIAADGKQYGPIPEAGVSQWLREGRVGGATQACRAGTTEWRPLSSFPEFADILRPPPLTRPGDGSGPMPAPVRVIAFGNFIACAISGLFLLVNIAFIIRSAAGGSMHLGAMFYLAWALVLASVPVRVISGIGLLRGREWARKLALWFAVLMLLHGFWGVAQNVKWLAESGNAELVLRSPFWLLTNLVNLVVFAFNGFTVFILARRDVRAAFAPR